MKSRKKTTTKNSDIKITTINKPVEQTHYCVGFFFFFQIITWKERKVCVLSKNLHQSAPYAQNDSCLACK